MPAPFGKAPTWAFVMHALGEFGVVIEEFKPGQINGEDAPLTYILKRHYKGKTYVFAGSFDKNERILHAVLQNICRMLRLNYRTIFGASD